MPQAKTEVALQISESCAEEVALQHSLFCSAEVIFTKRCAAASEKLHCNIEKAVLQESGAFLRLSCGFQAPASRRPRLGPAEKIRRLNPRDDPAAKKIKIAKNPCQNSAPTSKWFASHGRIAQPNQHET